MRKILEKKGYSLIEAVIVAGIFLLVIIAIMPFLKAGKTSWETDARLNRMLGEARMAMDKMVEELKYTNEIIAIDANYVKFGTAGEEYYLDDGNAGYSTQGVWEDGTGHSGFAGDYDISNVATSTAYYRFNPPVEGGYDIYIYYISASTNTNQARYRLYDTGGSSYSTGDVNQRLNGAPNWYKLWDSNTVSLSTAGTRLEIWSTGLGGAGTNYTVADGVKFVYRGHKHKIFYFAGNKIYYGSDTDIEPQTPSQRLLAENIYQISGTNFLTYYDITGTNEVTNPRDVAFIRIAFEVRDPENRVPPYKLISGVRRAVDSASRRLVINEINYYPPFKVVFFDDMDGNKIIDGVSYTYSTTPVYDSNAPVYSTYNNWFDNFDTTGDNGWTEDIIGGAVPWTHINCTGINNADFDATSLKMWITSSTCGGNYNNNADRRLKSANIILPATPIGTLYWNLYYSKWMRSGDIFCWQIYSGGSWINLGACESDSGADERPWSRRTTTNSNIDSYSGNTVRVGFRFTTDSSQVREGMRIENNVIYSYTSSNIDGSSSETNTMVRWTDSSIGWMTLWQRGALDVDNQGTDDDPNDDYTPGNAGRGCWGTFLDNDYPENIDASLVTPTIDLTQIDNPQLEFYIWRDFEGTASNYDGIIVQIASSGDSGWNEDPTLIPYTSWHQIGTNDAGNTVDTSWGLSPYYDCDANGCNGETTDRISTSRENPLGGRYAWWKDNRSWVKVTANLSKVAYSKIKIRFRFGSDNYGNSGSTDVHTPGVFIDDIKVYGTVKMQWIELYNPTPYSIKITDDNLLCDQNNVAACNLSECFRIYTQTHPGSGDTYDNIIPYDAGGNNQNYEIPPYGYAIVAAATDVYSATSPYSIPAGAVKLLIDDGAFGYNGLTYDFGQITLKDNEGNTVDYVGYNLGFFDNMEYDNSIWWSRAPSIADQSWERGDPTLAGDGFNDDHTLGATGVGYVWGTNVGGNYTNNAPDWYLYTPTIDIREATVSNYATLSFWSWRDFSADAGDYGYVQISSDGGATYTTLGSNITGGPSTQWEQVTISLLGAEGKVIILRYVLTEDNDLINDRGWYIDDVAVYFSWGGAGNGKTIERIRWQGASDLKGNWRESINNYGTPGYKNSVSP